MRIDILERKSEIISWIDSNESKAYMCNELKCKPVTLNNWLDKMGITYNGNQGYKGKRKDNGQTIPLQEILEGNQPQYQSYKLKNRLIDEGIKVNKCEECGVDEWNGKEIKCELDHIDGDSRNHKLENLRILCPNCHSQTPTFRSKKRE